MSSNDAADGRVTIFEIERFALNDGPGIRTVVFFKGCPLRCQWCSNPESQAGEPELYYLPRRCLGCARCVEACDQEALAFAGSLMIDRQRCNACGRCVLACNTTALSLAGRSLSVEEVYREVCRDEAFFRNSGGGVTFSGGEPTEQPQALRMLAELCHHGGLHTAIETCGVFPWETMRETLPSLDLFLFDMKHLDPSRHAELVGAGNAQVLDNFRRLLEAGKDMVVRFPLLPGINDDEGHLAALGDFLLKNAPGIRVDVLPFHRLGNAKYAGLGRGYTMEHVAAPTAERVLEVKDFFLRRGLAARVEQ
ncbi:MAG: glycyl-radical enzyme activating protein [Spirochaetia bacterium]